MRRRQTNGDMSRNVNNIEPSFGRPHLFILGAGASKAALPNGDIDGRQVPLLDELTRVIDLDDLLDAQQIEPASRNFEAFYSDLHEANPDDPLLGKLEKRVRDYFATLHLPPSPTIYDYLILSLREKDFIATFNWDPFLLQAAQRNVDTAQHPRLAFLHGCAVLGVCDRHRLKAPMPARCSECGELLRPSRLLFPVKDKDYASDPHIAGEWDGLSAVLGQAYVVTIFGFGAPATDAGAVEIMEQAWTKKGPRDLEEIEIIDIKPREQLRAKWDRFIVRSHYQITDNYFSSLLGRFPRRSCEALFNRLMLLQLSNNNRPPKDIALEDLQEWFQGLIVEEQ